MKTRRQVAASVAASKEQHPEYYCPYPRCLWRTAKYNPTTKQMEGGGYCPRHKR